MTDQLAPYIVQASKGTVLFKEGDLGKEMYFVHSGKVSLEKNMGGKNEQLAVLEKGDFFGEMSLLDDLPRSATAVVEEDAELLKIDHENFKKILQTNIEIAVRIIRKYAIRLRQANEKLKRFATDRKEIESGVQEIIESVKTHTENQITKSTPLPKLGELISQDGENTFLLTKETTLIGRFDPVTNLAPDFDLSEMDKGRSVSRRHARLQLIDGEFYLTEEIGVANGTFVNGKRVQAGRPEPISNNTIIGFGNIFFTLKIAKTN